MKKKILAIGLAFLMALTSLVGCGPKDDGMIDVKIILVLEDGTEEPHEINVEAGITLREALYQGELIDEESYSGFFVENINGHIAKAMEGVLWLQCDENGKQLNGTVDDITVEDGQIIKMVYTVAPNFDD